MNKNVGSYDVAVRFVLSCGLLAWGNHGPGWIAWIGLAVCVTAVTGRCVGWALLGIDTTTPDRPRPVESRRVVEASRDRGGPVMPPRTMSRAVRVARLRPDLYR